MRVSACLLSCTAKQATCLGNQQPRAFPGGMQECAALAHACQLGLHTDELNRLQAHATTGLMRLRKKFHLHIGLAASACSHMAHESQRKYSAELTQNRTPARARRARTFPRPAAAPPPACPLRPTCARPPPAHAAQECRFKTDLTDFSVPAQRMGGLCCCMQSLSLASLPI